MATGKRNTAEAAQLAEWNRTIAKFLAELSPAPALDNELESAIQQALSAHNTKALTAIAGELRDWANSLSEDQQEELERALYRQFGKGLREAGEDVMRSARAVLDRGTIREPSEYRLVRDWIEKVYERSSEQRDVARANAMLLGYETARGKRPR